MAGVGFLVGCPGRVFALALVSSKGRGSTLSEFRYQNRGAGASEPGHSVRSAFRRKTPFSPAQPWRTFSTRALSTQVQELYQGIS